MGSIIKKNEAIPGSLKQINNKYYALDLLEEIV